MKLRDVRMFGRFFELRRIPPENQIQRLIQRDSLNERHSRANDLSFSINFTKALPQPAYDVSVTDENGKLLAKGNFTFYKMGVPLLPD